MNIIWFLLIGLAAGWLAGQIMKGRGFGILGNLVVGVVGAFIGGMLLPQLLGGLIGALVQALLGALILLFIIGLIKKA